MAPVNSLSISPDFIAPKEKKLTYTHRTASNFDCYFISNQSDHEFSGMVSCRVSGRIPELWDPLTGSIDTTLNYQLTAGRSVVHLDLDAHQSIFLVFRHKAAATNGTSDATVVKTSLHPGPWKISFNNATRITTDTLFDWSQSSDSTVRYYSGIATYTTTFNYTPTNKPAFLDLGRVADIATVTLNDIDCGTVWTNNKLEVTKALHPGSNELRITVANTWANRLIGDGRLPEVRRHTWTSVAPHLDGQLLPAGLLGPLTLIVHASPSPSAH